MNEMVDRIAKVLAGGEEAWWKYDCPREEYRLDARSVLKAMREPTEAMREAGLNMVVKERDACRAAGTRGWSYNEVDIAWDAMIAAALTDSNGE